ncbi:hypothetical protein PY092_10715 [Muricauda sp. 334s03]|jgi:cytochrome c5|uniref:Cytochrome c n=1 Tax=Flagellimonas yonaguniensis TaxID=3031325 RepID=A0ABT5XZK3_9FLAO|nr:hypothetical protein [[Muricauda] yonaguniensis]MDF0716621.1 hypothetical protein [[Muricauda] yonaguniensis]
MKTTYKLSIVLALLAITGLTVVACSSTKTKYSDVPAETVADTADDFKIEKSGAQLWGETCNRCHIAPSPADYNDTDWETISLHMRVRANLTENESKKIEEFLKSAN